MIPINNKKELYDCKLQEITDLKIPQNKRGKMLCDFIYENENLDFAELEEEFRKRRCDIFLFALNKTNKDCVYTKINGEIAEYELAIKFASTRSICLQDIKDIDVVDEKKNRIRLLNTGFESQSSSLDKEYLRYAQEYIDCKENEFILPDHVSIQRFKHIMSIDKYHSRWEQSNVIIKHRNKVIKPPSILMKK